MTVTSSASPVGVREPRRSGVDRTRIGYQTSEAFVCSLDAFAKAESARKSGAGAKGLNLGPIA